MRIRQIKLLMNRALALSLLFTVATGLTGCGTASMKVGQASSVEAASGKEEDESFGNTEYGGVKSYLEYAGIEAQPDAADVRTIKIAYGYAGYPISYTTKDGVFQAMILRC